MGLLSRAADAQSQISEPIAPASGGGLLSRLAGMSANLGANPLFMMGGALLANAERGGNWGGAFRDFSAATRQARADMMEADAHKQERARADELARAIAQLPPQQQLWARMNPEAFAASMLRAQANGWEHGQGYSHAFRVNPDGTVTLGDALPLRPRQPIQPYDDPNDDEWEAF